MATRVEIFIFVFGICCFRIVVMKWFLLLKNQSDPSLHHAKDLGAVKVFGEQKAKIGF